MRVYTDAVHVHITFYVSIIMSCKSFDRSPFIFASFFYHALSGYIIAVKKGMRP